MRKIPPEFYLREDVVEIARDLIGKCLVTKINGILTSGIIVETEAYSGAVDRASHAYPNRITKRNFIMFEEGGHAYVYLIYGIHYLFNIVTNVKGKADAVLIRALQPVDGLHEMMLRRKKTDKKRITSGPGTLSQALGIDLALYGNSLQGDRVWLEETAGMGINDSEIIATTRVGVDYAGQDALLPWRFYSRDNPWISRK